MVLSLPALASILPLLLIWSDKFQSFLVPIVKDLKGSGSFNIVGKTASEMTSVPDDTHLTFFKRKYKQRFYCKIRITVRNITHLIDIVFQSMEVIKYCVINIHIEDRFGSIREAVLKVSFTSSTFMFWVQSVDGHISRYKVGRNQPSWF